MGENTFLGIGADLWVAIFTLALVLTTVGQAILILRAEELTRKALKVSQRQAVRAKIEAAKHSEEVQQSLVIAGTQAQAALEQARAANKALEQSETHARLALKPYVTVVPINLNITPINGLAVDGLIRVAIKCKLINSGQTPAERVRLVTDIKVVKWPPQVADFTVSGPLEQLSSHGIGREGFHENLFSKIVAIKSSELKTDAKRILLTGRMDYLDEWGCDSPHLFSLAPLSEWINLSPLERPGLRLLRPRTSLLEVRSRCQTWISSGAIHQLTKRLMRIPTIPLNDILTISRRPLGISTFPQLYLV